MEKNKVDGYIQLPKTTHISQEDEVRKASEYITKTIGENRESFRKIGELMREVTKTYFENIDYFQKSFLEIGKKLKPLFDTIKQNTKFATKICIENGFYPSPLMKISISALADCKNDKEIEEYLCSRVEFVINNEDNKKGFKLYYYKYRKILNEIFSLYKKENYRLCILSIINFVSIIFNECFDKKDFAEKYEINKKLKEKNYKLEDQYMLLSPYFEDENNIIINTLTKNYRDNPVKYESIPYNRNAIIHGYSRKFGTKENCLRWFSVLISSFELMCGFNLCEFKE